MALLLHRGPCMLRGLVHSAGRLSYPSQQQPRFITLTPPRATAAEGGENGTKAKTVGKGILAKRLAEAHDGLSQKQAGEIIETLLDDIMLSVAEGETVTIPGFGSFKKKTRAARKGRNPATGGELDIPEKDYPNFSAGTVFKGVVQTGSWEAYDEFVKQQKDEAAAKAKKK